MINESNFVELSPEEFKTLGGITDGSLFYVSLEWAKSSEVMFYNCKYLAGKYGFYCEYTNNWQFIDLMKDSKHFKLVSILIYKDKHVKTTVY